MPKADPKTEIRRERFRAYCVARGWFDKDRERWLVTEIAAASLKPRNKVSDLLNGKGSFGAQIARELEIALGLGEYDLESIEPAVEQMEVAMQPTTPPKPPSAADDIERYVGDVVNVLADYLQGIDEDGRDFVSMALAKFAKNPKGERERAIGVLASAMRTAPPQPIDPTPTGSRSKSKASVKAVVRPKLEVKAGGGQQVMFAIPVPPLQKIMRDEDAPAREQEWYEQLPKPPKVSR